MEDAATRRRTMQAVKSENTAPEMFVRRLLRLQGYRFRLYTRSIPGKPDIVFQARKKVIFVHGCFWHGHSCKRGRRQPKSNSEYWQTKITRNAARDLSTIQNLESLGWKALVIWECELRRDPLDLMSKLMIFLGPARTKLIASRTAEAEEPPR